jgi:hypothetical protein
MTPCTVPLEHSSLSSMEESATNVLRQGRAAVTRPQAKTNKGRNDDPEGDYVTITWICGEHASEGSIVTDPDEGNEAHTSRKRSRGDIQHQHTSSDSTPLHLRVEIFLQEEWSAEVIFCAASRDPSRKINAFAFCLARGLKSSYGEIWMWFESMTGTSVGRIPLGPTSEELANVVALWTKKDHESSGVGRTGPNGSSSPKKPLVLTFSVPYSLEGSGLDNLSLTVPPASLLHLCTNIEKERLKKRQKSASDTLDDSLLDEDEVSDEEGLPILKAMQCYIQEAFRINIQSFALVKASCAVASFGCDGRCKPLSLELLPDVLREIQTITRNRYARESHSAARDDDDDSSNSD